MKKIFTFLLVAGLMLNLATAQNVGEIAPDFTLKNLSNQNYKLSDNRGKVIMVFLVGYSCPFCIASAPSVKSKIIGEFGSNTNFQALVIDTWDGSASAVQNFKNSTGLDAIYLQKGSGVASGWSTTYDRLVVIDAEGKMVFKGSKAAKSDVDAAKTAVQNALNNITTSVAAFDNPDGFALSQNYPNPAQSGTTIEFSIGKPSKVTLSVFDITGKKILVPLHQYYSPGNYEVSIQQNQLKNGVYFYRFEADGFTSTKKMIIQ